MGDSLRLAVLISGTGSNLKTLIEAQSQGLLDVNICRVICNRPEARGLDHARAASIPIDLVAKTDRETQDGQITRFLGACSPDLVILAGYMRILGPLPVNRYLGRMINMHPSLLPLYPGLDTYARAIDAGDAQHGGSIHFVTPELDAGPVIAQVRVPILHGDRPADLAARLGPREHDLLTATVELFADRRVKMAPQQVLLDGRPLSRPLLLNEKNRLE